MPEKIDRTFFFPYKMKILGIVFIVFAGGLQMVALFQGVYEFKMAPVISAGLVFIFFSREKIDDERVHQFKFRALTLGFTAIYLFSFGFNYFSYNASLHEFVVMVLMLSTATFYYTRFKY